MEVLRDRNCYFASNGVPLGKPVPMLDFAQVLTSRKRSVATGGSKALVRSLMQNSNVYVTIFEMVLTRKIKKTVMARVGRDPALAKAHLDEAATPHPRG